MKFIVDITSDDALEGREEFKKIGTCVIESDAEYEYFPDLLRLFLKAATLEGYIIDEEHFMEHYENYYKERLDALGVGAIKFTAKED